MRTKRGRHGNHSAGASHYRFVDISRQRYGMVVALRLLGSWPKQGAVWLARCDCGARFRIVGKYLRRSVRSCGCAVRTRPVPALSAADLDRFPGRYEPIGDCWLWLGGKSPKGYGAFKIGRLNYGAHRVSWAIHRGAIPVGLHVLHSCDTPPCVNPGHLFLGTNRANAADRRRKKRAA